VLRDEGRADAVGRWRHRLAPAHRRMDPGAWARAGPRYLLLYPVRATVVCLGVAVGCAVRLAASACRYGCRGVGQQPGPGADFRLAVPGGATVERRAGGAGPDAGSRGRLGRTLAGASPPVHHVVHGDLLFHPRSKRRAYQRRVWRPAAVVAAAAADGAVDPSAWRVLFRHPADCRLRGWAVRRAAARNR